MTDVLFVLINVIGVLAFVLWIATVECRLKWLEKFVDAQRCLNDTTSGFCREMNKAVERLEETKP